MPRWSKKLWNRPPALKGFYIVQRNVLTMVRVPRVGPDALPGAMRDVEELVPESTSFTALHHSSDDRKTPEGQKAHADRVFVAGLTDANGDHPLDACFFMQLEPPDPPAPPEWNLANKDKDKPDSEPTKAYWSLQIAAFRGVPDAKAKEYDARQRNITATSR